MMKFNSSFLGVVAILAVLAAFSACNKAPARNDAQVAADVQSRINHDSRVGGREIGVQSADGVVTLNGNVDSESARVSAASDAANVPGVRTVVNNLIVQQAQETPPPDVQ